MKCEDFGIKCTDCRYPEECVIIVVEEDTPAKHTTIGWKCNKYNKYCVGMEPKKENMVLKEPEIEFKEYIGDDNVKMKIEFEDYYGNTVGEVIIERGDIYVKGRILPISKVEVADWESDNHVRLQSIKTNGGDNMENVEKLVIEEGKKEKLELIESHNNDDGSITVTFTNENLEDLEYGTEMMLYHLDMMLEKGIIYSHAYVGDDEDETKNVEITIRRIYMSKEEILNDLIKVERWDRYMENVFSCAYYEYSKDEEIEDFLHEMKKIAEKYNIHIPSKDEVNWDNEEDIPEYIVHERIGNSIVTDIREMAKRELL